MRPRIGKIVKISLAIFAILTVTLLSFTYVRYRELKGILIGRLSDKVTALIGQKVEIGDLSLSPAAGISLYDIRIFNPEGFESGRLLQVDRLYLKMEFDELLRQRLSFKEITVNSPELTLVKDAEGRLNISEKLMLFFEKKPAYQYHIDRFRVSSGVFEFNNDGRYSIKNIDLQLKNLSSMSGVKTSIQGSMLYEGSKVKAAGWIYLKDEPKRLNISVSSSDLTLRPMRALFEKYGVDTKKTKVAFDLYTEGDTKKGFYLKSEIRIGEAGFAFLRKEIREIFLRTSAFLSIPDRSLFFDNISLHAGGITAAAAKGQIKKIRDDFFYAGALKVERLDLSAFNFVKGVKANGTMTSDNIHFQGNLKKPMPEIDGTVQLKDAALTSKADDIKEINASLKFVSSGGMTLKTEGTAKLSKARGYPLDMPADAAFSLTARVKPKSMSVISSINLSPVETNVKVSRRVHFDRIFAALYIDIKDKSFAGKGLIESKGISFADYRIPFMKIDSSFLYRRNILTTENLAIEGEDFKATAKNVEITFPEQNNEKRVTVEIEGAAASYLQKEAGFKNAVISLGVDTGEDSLSGDFGFSFGGIVIKGLHAGSVTGSGSFGNKNFSVDVTGAQISGGNVRLAASGKIGGGFFPIRISSVAENIDIGDLAKETSKISAIPYDVSGDLKRVAFEGTVYSAASLQGSGEMRAEKIYLRKKDSKRNILKDVSLRGGIQFRGEDLDFRADADAGKVSTSVSGTMKSFLRQSRSAELSVKLPRVNAADIRGAFWDIFPDSLLYAGMDGSVSSDVSIDYGDRDLKVKGKFTFQNLALQGENGEYSLGPINGVLPIAYGKTDGKETIEMPSFERSEFTILSRHYSQKISEAGYSKITIGSLNYGFRFLDDVNIWVKQKGSVLNVGHFSGNIWGGRLNGSAVLDISKGLSYSGGFLFEGLSLRRLCEGIEPIKGYISGKVDGVAILKGSAPGISGIIGKADLWAYSTADEKTMISKEFLHKIGGASMKAYLGDRHFDKGTMSLYLQNGFVIFKELEISHRNFFGMTDLSIKVAPLSNRIAIDHLMWSISEAAQRAKEK